MPLWLIFHPPNTFTSDASQQALARDITRWYADTVGLPAFYVVVNFIPMSGNTMWVGGQASNPQKPFIRVAIEHIAVRMPDMDEVYARATQSITDILKPHVKGYDYEFHVDETERRLWRINGLVPPQFKSGEEKVWVRENRAVPPKEMK